MIRREVLASGRVKTTVLTNFQARIVQEFVVDDESEVAREFELETEFEDQKTRFVVGAGEFSRMTWVLRHLGPRAIIYPGQHQHARAAIQSLSGSISRQTIFTHLGWKKIGLDWVYLHSGGAVGPEPSSREVQVRLPSALERYRIQLSKSPAETVGAIRASLRLLSLASDRISIPLLASVYTAALGNADFSVFLAGTTGSFKTTLAALCQQHFGADMDATALPANFTSTANALEILAFSAKDALLVVDDFVPVGGIGDGVLQAIAERLFRSAGNHQGRSRMSGHGDVCKSQAPRALVLATGEEVPQGQSLRARLLIVEIRPGEVDVPALTECQASADRGELAAAMGAFLKWITPRYEEIQGRLRASVRQQRSLIHPGAVHARLPSAIAQLRSAWEIWLEFALKFGAITVSERSCFEQRATKALQDLAVRQAVYQEGSDPALRFLALLRTAISSRRAHVANREGGKPESAELWGWQQRKPDGRRWIPGGRRIGWTAGTDLFLDSEASYEVAQQAAGPQRLPISEQTLRHRIHQRGLLASTDGGRQMLLVRRTLEGHPRQVLHLRASDLVLN